MLFISTADTERRLDRGKRSDSALAVCRMALIAVCSTLAACGSPVPTDLLGVVPDDSAIAGGSLDGASWAVYIDETQPGADFTCVAAMSNLDISTATKCNDPTVDSLGAVAAPMSEGRILIAGWASEDAEWVTAHDAFETHSAETRAAGNWDVPVFAFLIDGSFEFLTVEDHDGKRLASRTAADLCRGRC